MRDMVKGGKTLTIVLTLVRMYTYIHDYCLSIQ